MGRRVKGREKKALGQASALFRLQPKRPSRAKAPPINQKVAGSGVSAAASKVAPLAQISVAKKAPAEFALKLSIERFPPPARLTSNTNWPAYGLLPPLPQTSQWTPYMKVPYGGAVSFSPGKENPVVGFENETAMAGLPTMLKSRASLPEAFTNPIPGNSVLLRVTVTLTVSAVYCVNNTVPNGPSPWLALLLKS